MLVPIIEMLLLLRFRINILSQIAQTYLGILQFASDFLKI
jgi:hypothetical protein